MPTAISRNEIFLGNISTNLDKQKNRIESLRQSLCDVKEIAKNNIHKVAEREEKLTTLSDRIDDLKEATQQFSNNAKKLKKNTALQMYYFLAIVLILCTILLISTLFAKRIV